eukprot:scaffold19426_cov86-Skeletonema_menzelii.AAC.1
MSDDASTRRRSSRRSSVSSIESSDPSNKSGECSGSSFGLDCGVNSVDCINRSTYLADERIPIRL